MKRFVIVLLFSLALAQPPPASPPPRHKILYDLSNPAVWAQSPQGPMKPAADEMLKIFGTPLALLFTECPKAFMVTVPRKTLLGMWVIYATTPLKTTKYQQRCISYDLREDPGYLDSHILFYKKMNGYEVIITYSCTFKVEKRLFEQKLRLLTRTHTPPEDIIWTAVSFLRYTGFAIETLVWLRAYGYCIELYELEFQTKRRPLSFQAPFNQAGPLGR